MDQVWRAGPGRTAAVEECHPPRHPALPWKAGTVSILYVAWDGAAARALPSHHHCLRRRTQIIVAHLILMEKIMRIVFACLGLLLLVVAPGLAQTAPPPAIANIEVARIDDLGMPFVL